MKNIIGFTLVFAGLVLGAYAGIWWALIGGIINVVEAIRAEELVPMSVATGIAKVVLFPLIAQVSSLVLVLPGWVLIDSQK